MAENADGNDVEDNIENCTVQKLKTMKLIMIIL